jgi:hypothetical protein
MPVRLLDGNPRTTRSGCHRSPAPGDALSGRSRVSRVVVGTRKDRQCISGWRAAAHTDAPPDSRSRGRRPQRRRQRPPRDATPTTPTPTTPPPQTPRPRRNPTDPKPIDTTTSMPDQCTNSGRHTCRFRRRSPTGVIPGLIRVSTVARFSRRPRQPRSGLVERKISAPAARLHSPRHPR